MKEHSAETFRTFTDTNGLWTKGIVGRLSSETWSAFSFGNNALSAAPAIERQGCIELVVGTGRLVCRA